MWSVNLILTLLKVGKEFVLTVVRIIAIIIRL